MALHVLDRVLDDDGDDRDTLVDIPTAAARLGLTIDGVRKRIQRHQLASLKRDGRVYVVLDAILDPVPDTSPRPEPAPDLVATPPSSTPSSTESAVSAESLAAQLARAD